MENLEYVKELFFFIGSILGIVAFTRTAINPLMDENRKKWKKILTIFDEDFFQSLEFVDQIRSVEHEQLSDLKFFLEEFREKKDYLEFKFPNKKIFDRHLKELVQFIRDFEKEISSPIWDVEYLDNGRVIYVLNKEFFHKKYDDHNDATDEYLKHLNDATNLVVKMRMEFLALHTIANLYFIELPFKRWIVKKAKTKHSHKLLNE